MRVFLLLLLLTPIFATMSAEQRAACDDGEKNYDEDDVDCGGGCERECDNDCGDDCQDAAELDTDGDGLIGDEDGEGLEDPSWEQTEEWKEEADKYKSKTTSENYDEGALIATLLDTQPDSAITDAEVSEEEIEDPSEAATDEEAETTIAELEEKAEKAEEIEEKVEDEADCVDEDVEEAEAEGAEAEAEEEEAEEEETDAEEAEEEAEDEADEQEDEEDETESGEGLPSDEISVLENLIAHGKEIMKVMPEKEKRLAQLKADQVEQKENFEVDHAKGDMKDSIALIKEIDAKVQLLQDKIDELQHMKAKLIANQKEVGEEVEELEDAALETAKKGVPVVNEQAEDALEAELNQGITIEEEAESLLRGN